MNRDLQTKLKQVPKNLKRTLIWSGRSLKKCYNPTLNLKRENQIESSCSTKQAKPNKMADKFKANNENETKLVPG